MSHKDFILKKTEKVVTVIYLVTDLLSSKEPMKWSLRKTALTLLGHNDKDIRYSLSEIISLLEISRSSKIISEMNTNILKDACQALLGLLDEEEKDSEIKPEILEIEMTKPSTGNKYYRTLRTSKKDLYDMSFKKPKIGGSSTVAQKRKDRVIEVLKNEGKATISDIKKSISGVSDKTLQRDLLALVHDGVAEKSGSRRWTTYSLL